MISKAVKDYDELKEEITKKVNNGYTLEMLYDLFRHNSAIDITNINLDFGYFDFNYEDMCLTVTNSELTGKPELINEIELYNDAENEFLGTYSYDELRGFNNSEKIYKNIF